MVAGWGLIWLGARDVGDETDVYGILGFWAFAVCVVCRGEEGGVGDVLEWKGTM